MTLDLHTLLFNFVTKRKQNCFYLTCLIFRYDGVRNQHSSELTFWKIFFSLHLPKKKEAPLFYSLCGFNGFYTLKINTKKCDDFLILCDRSA